MVAAIILYHISGTIVDGSSSGSQVAEELDAVLDDGSGEIAKKSSSDSRA